ncbi:MAG: Ig-like domain-containing protein, partial [Armatimonadota bacterium]
RYVTIPAGETHYLPQTHINMYFAEPDPDHMLRLLNRVSRVDMRDARRESTAEQRRAAGTRYWGTVDLPEYARFPLAFPHHTMWIGFREFTNAERQRLIEVHSTHGSSETRDPGEVPERLRMRPGRLAGDPAGKYSAREILNEGHHLGFVGGSDSHDGQPGSKALTGVFAAELTRKAVLEAMYERHCYATSANRTLIEFSANGTPMGQRMEAGGKVTLEGLVAGDGAIDRVEIINNGRVVHTQDELRGAVVRFTWTPPGTPAGYYYVRVILDDQGAAWSSPIRIEPAAAP